MMDKNVALITEAGNGLAKSFANILSENNYRVIIAACKNSFKGLLKENNKHQICDYLIETDFLSEEEFTKLHNHLENTWGKLDLLINNAEIVNGFGQKIEKINIDEVRELYEVNLFSAIRMIQIFKPLLEKSTHPKIMNITSSLGDIDKMKSEDFCYSNYYLPAYATSKAALNMFTYLQCKEFLPSKIKIFGFDPIARENCTHNDVKICDQIKKEFVSLI